jgi:hypothetical protein
MGYRVENYSYDEISTMSIKGKIAPSLFWAIPIGKWNLGLLDNLWHRFTMGGSLCNHYGYVFVKEHQSYRGNDRASQHRKTQGGGLDISLAAASLTEILPSAFNQSRRMSYENDTCNVLILAGSYPQPGWGLLIDISAISKNVREVDFFEEAIEEAVQRTAQSSGHDILSQFRQASEVFKSLGNEFAQLTSLESEIRTNSIKLRNLRSIDIRNCADGVVNESNLSQLQSKLSDIDRIISNNDLIESIKSNIKKLTAANIINRSDDAKIESISESIAEIRRDSSRRQHVCQQIRTEHGVDIANLLNACVQVITCCDVDEITNLRSWASSAYTMNLATLKDNIRNLSSIIEEKIGRNIREGDQLELERRSLLQQEVRNNFLYQAECGNAIELQSKLAPVFLVELEKAFLRHDVKPTVIAWDPPRMVGWKVFTELRDPLTLQDLWLAARTQFPDIQNIGLTVEIDNDLIDYGIDGSYFTDYVHHVAVSHTSHSTREVTAKFLNELLQPNQIKRLIRMYMSDPEALRIANDYNSTRRELTNTLLIAMGWLPDQKDRQTSVASLLQTTHPGQLDIAQGKTINDLRVALESYCKDIIDVAVSKLGYDEERIIRFVDGSVPQFQWRNGDRNWVNQVAHLTLGSAVRLLKPLLDIAFNGREAEISILVDDLKWLSSNANIASHDNMDAFREFNTFIPNTQEFALKVKNLLDITKVILGDLPWHMEVSSVFGDCPMVLSGEAWSHGTVAPRLLRVLCYDKIPTGKKRVMFWNRNRRNPVVPDAHFINRPGARSDY